jgi:hypothetical protein
LAFVGTDRSVHAVDEAGSCVFSAPLALDWDRFQVRCAGRLEDPRRYWVWFVPRWYLTPEILETLPAYVVEYDAAGRETARRLVPPGPGRPGDARQPDPRMLVFEPSYCVALSGLVTPPAEFAVLVGAKEYLVSDVRAKHGTEAPLLLPFLFFSTQFFLPGVGSLPRTPAGLVFGFAALMVCSAAVSGLVCFLLARRFAFSRMWCLGWLLAGFLGGATALLLMLALHEWPARIACPKCRQPRVVTRDTCEHCGALHAAPVPDGTEIFEPTAATPHAALVGR